MSESSFEKENIVSNLHVVDAVLDGDLGEGYASGGGFAGGEHAGEVQGGMAVFEVELVHGGRELGAVGGVGEEFFLVLVFGDEVAEGDADEEGAVEFGALRALAQRERRMLRRVRVSWQSRKRASMPQPEFLMPE